MAAPLIGSNSSGGFVALLATAGGALSVASVPGAADPGYSVFRNVGITNVAAQLKATGGNLYGLRVINPGANVAYLKFYNAPAANVNVGNTVPLTVFQIAPSSNVAAGNLLLLPTGVPLQNFSAGISVAAVNGLADNNTTAPVGTPYVEAFYN